MSASGGPGPLLLLDTATLYFRAHHALPSSLTAPDGTRSGAVRGTLDMLAVLVERYGPGQVVACWDDDWRPAWRVDLLASYKAHRALPGGGEEVPEGLGEQVEGLVALLAALGVPRVGAAAAEADDVAATLAGLAARAARGSGGEVLVVSGDRDLFQLVDDGDGGGAPVRVVYIGAGVRDAPVLDGAALAARTGLSGAALARAGGVGAAYADLAVLRGDPSDGLPGVAGIGEKTAAALLARYGELGVVRAAAEDAGSDLSPAQRRRLREASDYLDRAPGVVAVRRDLELALPARPVGGLRAAVDDAALAPLVERWGVQGPAGRLLAALEAADGSSGG